MSVPPGAPVLAGGEGAGSPGPGRSRRRLVAAAVLVLAAATIAVAPLLTDDRTPPSAGAGAPVTTDSPTAGATDSPTESPTGSPTGGPTPTRPTAAPPPSTAPEPAGATVLADEPPPSLPEVALDAPAAVGNGIVATLPSIEAVQGTATGPGNVNGPALRVTVRIENGTDREVSLDGVAANLYTGADRTPASPLDDASQRPFGGSVAAGETAEAVYVFSVPTDARDAVTVEVGYEAGAPLLLFTGPVG